MRITPCLASVLALWAVILTSTHLFAATERTKAEVVHDVSEQVKANSNWKSAFATADHAQVVFMNISPVTNPKNEIGRETHEFDQILFIIEGEARAILDGQESEVKSGDMIFVPQGTEHNVINVDSRRPLKVMSVYSSNDIPANSSYSKKSDEAAGQ